MIFFPSDDRALIEFILSTFNYRKKYKYTYIHKTEEEGSSEKVDFTFKKLNFLLFLSLCTLNSIFSCSAAELILELAFFGRIQNPDFSNCAFFSDLDKKRSDSDHFMLNAVYLGTRKL
jgi:hypothetical protein